MEKRWAIQQGDADRETLRDSNSLLSKTASPVRTWFIMLFTFRLPTQVKEMPSPLTKTTHDDGNEVSGVKGKRDNWNIRMGCDSEEKNGLNYSDHFVLFGENWERDFGKYFLCLSICIAYTGDCESVQNGRTYELSK